LLNKLNLAGLLKPSDSHNDRVPDEKGGAAQDLPQSVLQNQHQLRWATFTTMEKVL
jgi:hypothetical protein